MGAGESAVGDMLELEHVIGYTGRASANLHCHPKRPTDFLTSLGANVVIGDIEDPHRQEFLRAHDEEVSALMLSPSGLLIASGQHGSSRSPDLTAPVVVWDYERRRQIFNLFGITQAVTALAFAPDDQFLAAAGADNMMYVWDMQTGEQLVGKKFSQRVTFLEWGPVETGGRRPEYKLLFAYNKTAVVANIRYELRSMRYAMTQEAFSLPSSGFVRDYFVGYCGSEFLVTGTAAGEFSVFSLRSQVYRNSIRVSTNGVLSITGDKSTDVIYVGSGDGMLHCFQGSDSTWKPLGEVRLRGRVVALSLSADRSFLLAGTSAGLIYRVDTAKMAAVELQESHVASVTCVSFGKTRSDVFCTASVDGSVRVWDLSDYRVLQDIDGRAGSAAATCVLFDETAMVSGWEDGVLRCHEATDGSLRWKVAAHRGAVNSVAGTELYLVTGGADNKVRVWSRRTHQLMLQFAEHVKEVVAVLPDLENPRLIHSAGKDRCVFTYDLKAEKRVVGHQMGKTGVGTFTALTQRKDSEQELITGGTDGKLLFWDCDIDRPVLALQDPAKSRVNSLAVSPSGRFLALCGDDHHVKIFDLVRQALLAATLGHSGRVLGLHWSPDEKQLVSVGADCCICVWNFYGID